MDKLIIVIYIGAEGLSYNTVFEMGESILKSVNNSSPDIIAYAIPDNSSKEIRVECLNPKLMTEQEYADVKTKLEKIDKAMENIPNLNV